MRYTVEFVDPPGGTVTAPEDFEARMGDGPASQQTAIMEFLTKTFLPLFIEYWGEVAIPKEQEFPLAPGKDGLTQILSHLAYTWVSGLVRIFIASDEKRTPVGFALLTTQPDLFTGRMTAELIHQYSKVPGLEEDFAREIAGAVKYWSVERLHVLQRVATHPYPGFFDTGNRSTAVIFQRQGLVGN